MILLNGSAPISLLYLAHFLFFTLCYLVYNIILIILVSWQPLVQSN